MENRETSSDEIDLQELLLKFVLTIKRNLVLIVSFFIVGSLLGFTYATLGTKVYESNMMVTSDILTESYVEVLGENLNKILKDQNTALVAEKLSLTPDQAKQVASVKILGVLKEKPIENYSVDETVRRTFFLGITANVLDPEVLPPLQNGIISYLQDNEFVKTRVEQKRNYYKRILKKLDEELASMEQLKNRLLNGEFLEKAKGNVMFDPSEINSKIIFLNEKKFEYENDLEIVNSIQVVEGFTKFQRPIKPSKAVSVTAGASLGLLFVVLLIGFKSVRSLVKMAEKR